MEECKIPPKKPPRRNISCEYSESGSVMRKPLIRKQILRTPSQLYRFIKPCGVLHNRAADDVQIIGPEFVVRSKGNPKKIDLIKNKNKEMMAKKVTVVKLCGERVEISCDPSTACVSHIFKACVQECVARPFLGVARLCHGEFHFLPPSTKLSRVAPKGWKETCQNKSRIPFDNFTLYLRFLLYPKCSSPPEECRPICRLMYLQLRHDLIDGRLLLSPLHLRRLASLALRAEFGHVRDESGDYFLLEHFLPESCLESSSEAPWSALRSNLVDLHAGLSAAGGALSPEAARGTFISEAQRRPHAGAHFYQAFAESNRKVWVGGNAGGLYVLNEPASFRTLGEEPPLPWIHVRRLCVSSRRMILHWRSESGVLRKMKLRFRQQEGCDFVVFAFKELRKGVSGAVGTQESLAGSGETRRPSDKTTEEPLEGSLERLGMPSQEGERDGLSKSGSESGGGSFRFGRFRACRNWGKRSPGVTLGGRCTLPLSSFQSGEDSEAERLSPLSNCGSADFRRGLEDSFSVGDSTCPSPLAGSADESTHKGVNTSQDPLLTPRTCSSIAHSTPITGLTLDSVTPVTRESSFLSASHSFGSLHSPTRTCVGVRMGTRVPNALLNKHKFVGIDSPPSTLSRKRDGSLLSPVVIEPNASPSQTVNETVNESLLSRFMKAPTLDGATERRLRSVTLCKESGSLGLYLGVGSDRALYIQGIVPKGPAETQGVLQPGDRLVGVNGLCVDSLSYGHTIDLLRRAQDQVCLLVSQPASRSTEGLHTDISMDSSTNTEGKYVTIIPVTPDSEVQIPPPKYLPKRLQFLYQEV